MRQPLKDWKEIGMGSKEEKLPFAINQFNSLGKRTRKIQELKWTMKSKKVELEKKTSGQ